MIAPCSAARLCLSRNHAAWRQTVRLASSSASAPGPPGRPPSSSASMRSYTQYSKTSLWRPMQLKHA
eukprot:9817060-Heterocapsa_arctica.AAC.1